MFFWKNPIFSFILKNVDFYYFLILKMFFIYWKKSHFTALAIGQNYVVVSTNKNTIRAISLNGTQKSIFSVSGPVLTVVAKDEFFAIFYHQSDSAVKGRGFIKNNQKIDSFY